MSQGPAFCKGCVFILGFSRAFVQEASKGLQASTDKLWAVLQCFIQSLGNLWGDILSYFLLFVYDLL